MTSKQIQRLADAAYTSGGASVVVSADIGTGERRYRVSFAGARSWVGSDVLDIQLTDGGKIEAQVALVTWVDKTDGHPIAWSSPLRAEEARRVLDCGVMS